MMQYGSNPWYRHVCAVGGVLNLVMMVSANLVGFVIGTEGVMHLLKAIFGTWSGEFASFTSAWLSVSICVAWN